MVLEILKYGHPALREKSMPVAEATPELLGKVRDMLETMYAAKGVGLAAQQVGMVESVCVIDVPESCEDEEDAKFNAAVKMPLVMFNPVIVATEGEQEGKEGCLSFPNMSAPLKRPMQVTCQYMDAKGTPQMATARGFLARAIMHETDHLRGVVYVDLLEEEAKAKIAKRLEKMAKKNGGAA